MLKKGQEIQVPYTKGRQIGDEISIGDANNQTVVAIGKVVKWVLFGSTIVAAVVKIIG